MVSIGIDLGTTHSCVATYINGRPQVIQNCEGSRTTPSWVFYSGNSEERIVGEQAREDAATAPQRAINNVKRIIGRYYDDSNTQKEIQLFPFTVRNVNNHPRIEVEEDGTKKLFSPQQVSAVVLEKLKQAAEVFLGETVENVCVTVPAHFNNYQRTATQEAAKIAGFTNIRLLNEPTAAAIAYGIDHRAGKEQKILVFDLGGGTLDVSILRVKDKEFQVLATAGDNHLGGEDFDNLLVEYLCKRYHEQYRKNIGADNKALRRLRNAAEAAKRRLSSQLRAVVDIYALCGNDFNIEITRAKFNDLCQDRFNIVLNPVKQALEDAHLKKSAITDIVMVGGSSRIVEIQNIVKTFFADGNILQGVNPDEAIACGAAVHAAANFGDPSSPSAPQIKLMDVTPLSLGTDLKGGLMSVIIPRNTTVPCKKTQVYSNAFDNQKAVGVLVYQGERALLTDNYKLPGSINIPITPKPRGESSVAVTFEINEDGILEVSATDLESGHSETIVINDLDGSMTSVEINEAIENARHNQDQDEQARQRVRAKQELEEFITKSKKFVSEAGLKKDVKEKAERQLHLAEMWLNVCDPEMAQLKGKMTELQNALKNLHF